MAGDGVDDTVKVGLGVSVDMAGVGVWVRERKSNDPSDCLTM